MSDSYFNETFQSILLSNTSNEVIIVNLNGLLFPLLLLYRLTQMMLQQYPALRQSKTTLQAYYLILNAMEVMAQEKKKMIMANQELLKELIVAAKVSENQLKGFFAKNLDRVCSSYTHMNNFFQIICSSLYCTKLFGFYIYLRSCLLWTSRYTWMLRL